MLLDASFLHVTFYMYPDSYFNYFQNRYIMVYVWVEVLMFVIGLAWLAYRTIYKECGPGGLLPSMGKKILV